MKKWSALIALGFIAACTYVPPEAVSPIAELCAKYGMDIHLRDGQISCSKKDDR